MQMDSTNALSAVALELWNTVTQVVVLVKVLGESAAMKTGAGRGSRAGVGAGGREPQVNPNLKTIGFNANSTMVLTQRACVNPVHLGAYPWDAAE
jgi:hypothetical protein